MIDSEMIEHLVIFLRETPRSVYFDNCQGKNYVVIRGNEENHRSFNNPDLKFDIYFDNLGNITNISGVEVAPNDAIILELKEAIKINMKKAFRIKLKKAKLQKGQVEPTW